MITNKCMTCAGLDVAASVAKERSSVPRVSWNLGAIIGILNDSVLLRASRRL